MRTKARASDQLTNRPATVIYSGCDSPGKPDIHANLLLGCNCCTESITEPFEISYSISRRGTVLCFQDLNSSLCH